MLLQHVRLVPDSEVPTSFNHLVGAGEQRGGQFQAKRRGRLQVYDELKFRWLRPRQVRGPRRAARNGHAARRIAPQLPGRTQNPAKPCGQL